MECSNYTVLVKNAQDGDENSLNQLAALAEESLRRYVFRITLDENLTQDIVQEVMLEMVKFIGKLKRPDRFFAWLHGIAFNLLRRHYGARWREKTASGGALEADLASGTPGAEGLAALVNAEIKQIIYAAMGNIEPRHRAILAMRCYEGLSYKEIAEQMNMKELSARALFFRAKNALARELARRGLGKGSLLTALVLFGKMTAVSEAAAAQVAVTAATIKVGLAAGIIGAAGTEAVVLTTLTGAVITTATIVAVNQVDSTPAVPRTETRLPASADTHANAPAGATECWYYYPQGVHGPVIMRSVVLEPDGRRQYCKWLQNDKGNYSYDPRANVITLVNHRIWQSDFSVRRLPTDSPEMSDFISQVQSDGQVMEYIGSRGRDLLVVATTGGDASAGSWTTRHCNALDEDYFKCDWPRRTRLVDARDAMHQRGWTFFTVEGQLRGRQVHGTGCLPFVYEISRTHAAWLSLRVGDRHIVGDAAGLVVSDAGGRVIESWSGAATGGVFAGLGRPWAGLHTIDTIRRDAAMARIRFETRADARKAAVVLHCDDLKVEYDIDMQRDLIEQIAFVAADGSKIGNLRFSYDEAVPNITAPRLSGGRAAPPGADESEATIWLINLVMED